MKYVDMSRNWPGLLDEDGYHNSSGNGLWKVTLGSLIGKAGLTKTLGGCSYFVTFIDDHSRKVWVYTLKTKDQVLDVFKQFHALVERQTGKKLKCIRSDNGGEYIGPFDAYYREHGCLLLFGVRLLNTAGYILWMVMELCISKDERSKLDVKNKPCVFLGYGQDELGYRRTFQHNDDPIDLDPVPPKHFDAQFGDDIQNDEEQNDEKHGADDVDAQEQPNLDEVVNTELPVLCHYLFHLGGSH
ncbi:retrovirus-related pol polyprotein from transposon TNT 1-94 [Tanacetum coccineum]